MITIELPEKTTWYDVTLDPEARQTKEPGDAKPDRLAGWVSLGEPVPIPITLKRVPEEDHDLRHFIQSNSATYNFYLVHLACTFKPAAGEKFVNAWLAVDLSRADGGAEPKPIAWSMKPDKLEKPIEFTQTAKVGVSLKLVETVIGPEAGLEEETKYTTSEIFLEALNELQSNPVWEFSRTSLVEIRGGHRLLLMVRAPAGSATQGTVSLSATVERKRFGIIPYRASFPDAPPLTFRLP